MRVGVVGYGLAGRIIHAPLLRSVDGFQIVGVVARQPARRQQALDDNPGVTCYDSADEMIADAALDLAVVASPTASTSRSPSPASAPESLSSWTSRSRRTPVQRPGWSRRPSGRASR